MINSFNPSTTQTYFFVVKFSLNKLARKLRIKARNLDVYSLDFTGFFCGEVKCPAGEKSSAIDFLARKPENHNVSLVCEGERVKGCLPWCAVREGCDIREHGEHNEREDGDNDNTLDTQIGLLFGFGLGVRTPVGDREVHSLGKDEAEYGTGN